MPHALEHQIGRAREHVTPIAGEFDRGVKQHEDSFLQGKRRKRLASVSRDVIHLRRLIWRKQMVKCSKAKMRRLKAALPWRIPDRAKWCRR
jgi:hypothetical protein